MLLKFEIQLRLPFFGSDSDAVFVKATAAIWPDVTAVSSWRNEPGGGGTILHA